MDFYKMINFVMRGAYCYRMTWGAGHHYVGLFMIETGAEERLALFKPEVGENGTWYPWTVSRSDLEACDWQVVAKPAGSLRVAASPVLGKTTVQ